MKTLVTKVRNQNLFQPGETVVVAVSGGADSVALLDIMTRLECGLRLVVAHLNHCLRGAESDADQAFVASLADNYHLPFVSQSCDVADLARRERLSLEDAGRRARYAFLEQTAEQYGAFSIALAHHQDDQAETVLIRLLRGSGGTGLSAMAGTAGDKLKRPLLQVSRVKLEQYLKQRELSYRTDSTNADTAILRNSIRHELIPLLRRYNPKVSERLAATAEILAGDEELLEGLTQAAYQRLASAEGGQVRFQVEPLMKEPRALRLRLYRRALTELRGDLMRIGLAHLEAIDLLAASPRPNAEATLPGACRVSRCYGSLSLGHAAAQAPPLWEQVVAGEGRYPLPGGGVLLVERLPRPDSLDTGSRWSAFLSPETVPFPWLLRGFRPGDRFTPLGMSGAQKIKDAFINEKVPPQLRRRIPLLLSEGEIAWVPGVRLAERGRVTPRIDAVLRVEILEITP
ncbi:tRNA(Ile) lysidine-34 synthase, putative [Citrifermentans bemidjiense Bem]|uniref:tRNA(Ile)-lysidine synthase n=1 Tax=Citrifermentans bemidjiense (strain ATCC BAA-1014 / DSM 16622 / JCM 12645 / Bem) TaxID=404380 RepID=B5EHB2_CITBB|nr:tRNA lysidine(34) synthetase TilS [Citrifermentans bemidjiense]ACH39648.1 tRNA(Ile) lysidine-34 synthase, putative [Citrifermentans bemidjiense Bem]